MRATWMSLLAVPLLAPLLMFAQQPGSGPVAASDILFENGAITNGTYSNVCLGFSLQIPAGWQTPYAVTVANARHIPGGLSLLLLRQQAATNNVIWLIARQNISFGGTTEQLVSKLVHDYVNISPGTRSLLRDAYLVKYGEQQFVRGDYRRSLADGDTSYMAFLLTNFRGFFLGGSLAAGSLEELNKEADAFHGISFQKSEIDSRCHMGPDHESPPGGVIGGVLSSKPISYPPGWEPTRVRVSQSVSQSLQLKKVDPQYPEEARLGHIEGQVVLTAIIDVNGDVQELSLVSGNPVLASAAQDAVRQWKYRPYLLNGEPMTMETQVTVSFTLTPR